MAKSLKPAKQKVFKRSIAGFDIETEGNKNNFVCASIFHDDNTIFFSFDKYKIIEHFKSSVCKNKIIVATNLGFDFHGLFGFLAENFEFLYRGGEMLSAKTFIYYGNFIHPQKRKQILNECKSRREYQIEHRKFTSLSFIDTFAFSPFSVETLGDIIKIKKFKKPKCFKRIPIGETEENELREYNIQDSKISKLYTEFLFKGLQEFGSSIKSTIGSCTMSLFRNKYLKDTFYTHDTDDILKLFNAYYGGRTEAFQTGTLLNYPEMPYTLYDVNSLYPSVMLNEFPNPNSMRHSRKNNDDLIMLYHGISDVELFCPYMKYPLLPVRTKDKLLFPIGNFRGYYTHIELRKAKELGYKIKKVHETYYFKETCFPFKEFVNDLYKKRMEYKEQKSEMEIICKLLLNSLYGKFGQKFLNKENIISSLVFDDKNKKYKKFEMYNDSFVRVTEDREPSPFCIPEWAAYVTAYGRLKLYDYMIKNNPVYCDTDSVITRNFIETTDNIGDMKKEMELKGGIIIKPKFYAILNKSDKPMFCKECGYLMTIKDTDINIFECQTCKREQHRNKIKIKGIPLKLKYNDFKELIFNNENHEIHYEKFTKFKESMRRGLDINEIIPMIKKLNLKDNKRVWNENVNYSMLNDSEPINIDNLKDYKMVLYNEQELYNPVLRAD